MSKKILALLISSLMALSPLNVSGLLAAYAVDSSPFSVQDNARQKSVERSQQNYVGARTQTHKTAKTQNLLQSASSVSAKKGAYVVKFRDSATMVEINECVSGYTYQLLGNSRTRLFEINISSPTKFQSQYASLIESFHADSSLKLCDEPNDTYYKQQWELSDLNIPQAWQISKGSSDIKVAILDSGFDRTHEDFNSSQILSGCDVTNDDSAVTEDVEGHGTEVASVVAAATNNSKGIAGAGWNVTVMPFKIADENGDIYDSSVISAITMAADAGCSVISMSIGEYEKDNAVQAAVNYASSKGCVVVAAAGNEGDAGDEEAGQLSYPASYDGVISVAATDRNNARCYFSQYNSKVDVSAPGENVLVAAPFTKTGYTASSGTSFSTPYVASVAALAKSVFPSLTGDEFEQLIENTSTDLGAASRDDQYGWGLINAQKLLEAAECPIVLGVRDGGAYYSARVITFNRGTATLNGQAFPNGGSVTADGSYTLVVTDTSGRTTTILFKLDTVAPSVTGVTNGGCYNTDRQIAFSEGTATLNGRPFESGGAVQDEGSYTLIVQNAAGNQTTVKFTIDKTAPAVTGVQDGGVYHAAVSLSYNEGTASLNGSVMANHTTVSAEGSYTLTVTDAAGNSTNLSFSISGLPKTSMLQMTYALSDWVYDSASGYLCAISYLNAKLFFINPSTMTVDTTVSLSSTPYDILADGGKLYIALDKADQIQVFDIATKSLSAVLTTAKDPYQLAKDGNNLFYTQYDQWCEVRKYDLSTGTDADICTSFQQATNGDFFEPAIAVNTSLHVLYIGESGGFVDLYRYNEATGNLTSSSGYETFQYADRNVVFNGESVFFGGRRLDPADPSQYSKSFYGANDVLYAQNGCIVTKNGSIYDESTMEKLGSCSTSVLLVAQTSSNELLSYDYSTKTITKADGANPIGFDTIVGMLSGTCAPSAAQPGTSIRIGASSYKLPMNMGVRKLVADDADQLLFAIPSSGNCLYCLSEQDLRVEKILPLSADPTDLVLNGGKLYASIDEVDQIMVIDPSTEAVSQIIHTAVDPYQMAVDGGVLFYTQADQWCQIHRVDLVTGTDTRICTASGAQGAFYSAVLAVNPVSHLLYIGTTDQLFACDESTGEVTSESRIFETLFASRSIAFDGTDVLYAGRAFDPSDVSKITGDFTSGAILQAGNGYFLVGDGPQIDVYDSGTLAEIGESGRSYSLAETGSEGALFVFDGNGNTLYKYQGAQSTVDSADIVSLCGGTAVEPLQPVSGVTENNYTISLAMDAKLSKWVLDEGSQTLVAISTADKYLLFINSQSLSLEKVVHFRFAPTDLIDDGGKLYVAFDDAKQIVVFDAAQRTQESVVSTAGDPNQIAKDGSLLFYAGSNNSAGSYVSNVYQYDLATGNEKCLIGSLQSVKLAVDSVAHMLYIGESSYLHYYNITTGSFSASSELGNSSGALLYDSGYVYYNGVAFDADQPKELYDIGENVIFARNGFAFTKDYFVSVDAGYGFYLPMTSDLAEMSQAGDLYLYSGSAGLIRRYSASVEAGVSGVEDGGEYADQVTITFITGTAYLDNQPIASGTVVTGAGDHTLLYFDDNNNCQSFSFTIYRSVQSVSLNKTQLDLDINGKETLAATILPSDAADQLVTWTSSNTSIATVSDEGRVVGVAAGDATITAMTDDGQKTAACQVHVGSTVLPPVAVQSVSLDKSRYLLDDGDIGQLTATVSPADADDLNVTWVSDNPDVADVDDDGYIYAYSSGTARITATTESGLKSASCTVVVIDTHVTGISLNKTSLVMNAGTTQSLTATVAPSNADDKTVSWTSSNPSVATVDRAGSVTAVSAGTTTVTAVTEDGQKTASCRVAVAATPVTGISLNRTYLVTDTSTPCRLTATITPSNADNKNVVWASDNTNVATVDQSGLVTPKATGVANVSVTTEVGGLTATCNILVVRDSTPPVVTGVADHGVYNRGKSITFNEGTAVLNGQPFANGAMVSQDGSYTLVVTDAAGNSTIVGFTIDTTPPVITINPYSTQLTTGPVTVTAAVSGGTLNAASHKFTSNGSFTFTAKDAAGNAASKTVTVSNITSKLPNEPVIRSNIDSPAAKTYYGGIPVSGWAVARSGLSRVDFYADNNVYLGSVNTFTSRADVQKAVNANGYYVNENNGYSFVIPAGRLKPGTHTLKTAAIDKTGKVQWQTRTFTIGKPATHIDRPANNTTVQGAFTISGWAVNASGVSRIDVYVDLGTKSQKNLGSVSSVNFAGRADVQKAIYPNGVYPTGNKCGYSTTIAAGKLSKGKHTLYIAAIGNDGTVQWASVAVTVK